MTSRGMFNLDKQALDDNIKQLFAHKQPAHHCHPEADHYNLNQLQISAEGPCFGCSLLNLTPPQTVILSAAKELDVCIQI